MGEIFKSTKQQKEEARRRLNSKECKRGNDSDYAKELIKTYKIFSESRERANKLSENNHKGMI